MLYALGKCYEREAEKCDLFTSVNQQQAFHYYKLAAEQGHAESQYDVKRFYCHGIGVPSNIEEAQGHADAIELCKQNRIGGYEPSPIISTKSEISDTVWGTVGAAICGLCAVVFCVGIFTCCDTIGKWFLNHSSVPLVPPAEVAVDYTEQVLPSPVDTIELSESEFNGLDAGSQPQSSPPIFTVRELQSRTPEPENYGIPKVSVRIADDNTLEMTR